MTTPEELRQKLPGADEAEQEAGARRVILLLLDSPIDASAPPLDVSRRICPNCGVNPCPGRSPYCSLRCREEAAFVRQFRAALRDDAILDSERQIAIGQNLWHLIGGGRPLRRSMIPARSISRVIERNNGKCTHCDHPATTVDHILSACNREINLQPVCAECSQTHEFGDRKTLSSAAKVLTDLATRCLADSALRPCDNQDTWDWRAWIKP